MSGPVDLLRRMAVGATAQAPVARLLDFTLTEVEPGRAVVALEATQVHHNPMGYLHDGVVCDIADAAMGFAYMAGLQEGETFTTIELKINFLRPVWSGLLTATAGLLAGGRTIGLTECDVRDDSGRLVARAMSTCVTLRGDRATGR